MLIVGTGGLAKQLISFPCIPSIRALYNDVDEAIDTFWDDYEVVRTRASLEKYFAQNGPNFLVAISNGSVRKSMEEQIIAIGGNPISIVSEFAALSKSSEVGNGSMLLPQTLVEANATIGSSCLVNVGAIITHDVVVEDYCDIGPKAMLLGGAVVNVGASIGAGAIIMPRVRIGRNSIVGAGAVVTRDVLPGTTVVGVPAKAVED